MSNIINLLVKGTLFFIGYLISKINKSIPLTLKIKVPVVAHKFQKIDDTITQQIKQQLLCSGKFLQHVTIVGK